jgi:hypothetical protein
MSYTSPFIDPTQYISTVTKLSSEGVDVDAWFARIIREADDFAGRYSSDFLLVSEVKDALDAFNPVCSYPKREIART